MEIKITKIRELNKIWEIKNRCVEKLINQNIQTWDKYYPSFNVFENDQKLGHLYSIFVNNRIIGSVCLNEELSEEYLTINWTNEDYFVIHRLMIDPNEQGNGYAKEAMMKIENIIKSRGKSSIRLAVYEINKSADLLYKKLGYILKGKVQLKNGCVNMYEKIIL